MDRESLIKLSEKAQLRDLSDPSAASDWFEVIRLMMKEDKAEALRQNKRLRGIAGQNAIKQNSTSFFDLYNKTLLLAAPHDFDSFMLYIEKDRPASQRYWQPRRSKLYHVCRALQELEDGELDELFLAQPPRTGKTTLMDFFIAWIMGRDSERSNLYSSFTDSVCVTFYNGLLEILSDNVTYLYYDVFPAAKVASQNAKDLLINLDRKKRYASFTGRSLYGTLNGACDCNGYLIADDLIGGIEEAMNKDRLNNAWAKVDNNLLPRAKEGAKILWIGTRWSLIDPQGKRIDLLENDPKFSDRKWKVISTPALNEEDESNFEYAYGVGFSTAYYQQRRASFERNNDLASWSAQYQGQPIERDGSVFSPNDMRFYNGVLPDGDPDRVFMAVDPAWGGGDFVAAPVCYQFGDDIYVADVVYSNEDKKITQPMIVNAIEKYNVAAVKVEGTKMTAAYGEDIDKILRDHGKRINMVINTSHFTGNGKRQRIFDKAPDIRERMVFLADGHRSKPYSMFMQSVYSFTVTGKAAKNDDAPDSLSMAIDFAFNGGVAKADVMNRPW